MRGSPREAGGTLRRGAIVNSALAIGIKRNFVGIEIDAHYYAIAKARIEGERGDYPAVNLFAGELPFGE